MADDPKTETTIRRATPADGFLIEALTRRIWSGRVGANSTVFRETADTVSAQLASGGGVILMQDGEAIGSGRWVRVPGPGGQGTWMEVKRIGVVPAMTGTGLGGLILGALEVDGQDAGMRGAQLAVRSDQPRLVDYYAALGYVLADDVDLTTMNPLEPAPFGMRKIFKD